MTVGTVMERSHLPLTKWAVAFHKMAASKKGISAKQMQRELNLGSCRTAWFLCHRIREAMRIDGDAGPIGGEDKTVESDETFVGGKKKDVHDEHGRRASLLPHERRICRAWRRQSQSRRVRVQGRQDANLERRGLLCNPET